VRPWSSARSTSRIDERIGRPWSRLTVDGMKDILAQLSVEHYSAGPEPEHDDPSKEIWTFGYDLDATEVYIKLRLAPIPKSKGVFAATVWSFHEAERKLRYPLKDV